MFQCKTGILISTQPLKKAENEKSVLISCVDTIQI